MSVATFTLPNGQTYKLGRIKPVAAFDYGPFRVRKYANGKTVATLRLGAYFDSAHASAPPPDSTDRLSRCVSTTKRMYKNDQYGDCVVASMYHRFGLWTGNDAGAAVEVDDATVVSQYHKICGPGDNGCIITDVLDAAKRGVPMADGVHRIDDYVSVDHTNKQLVMVALYLFGAGPVGIDLPSAWANGPDVWDVTNSGVVGGHDVNCADYDARGVKIETWGGTRTITWPAFTSRRWITEFDVPLGVDWYGKDNVAPNGIDKERLLNDLAMLKNGQIPPVDPPTPPLLDWTP